MEKKNYEICEKVKKKSCHVHNIFTINYTWLIIISSKNLWQINCGNGIAKISEKNQVQLTMVLKTEPDIKPFFFFNFQFNPSFARFLTGCWPVFRVLTGSDWLSVPGWTGRSGPVFKTLQLTRCKLKYNILILKWCKQKKSTQNTSTIFLF